MISPPLLACLFLISENSQPRVNDAARDELVQSLALAGGRGVQGSGHFAVVVVQVMVREVGVEELALVESGQHSVELPWFVHDLVC